MDSEERRAIGGQQENETGYVQSKVAVNPGAGKDGELHPDDGLHPQAEGTPAAGAEPLVPDAPQRVGQGQHAHGGHGGEPRRQAERCDGTHGEVGQPYGVPTVAPHEAGARRLLHGAAAPAAERAAEAVGQVAAPVASFEHEQAGKPRTGHAHEGGEPAQPPRHPRRRPREQEAPDEEDGHAGRQHRALGAVEALVAAVAGIAGFGASCVGLHGEHHARPLLHELSHGQAAQRAGLDEDDLPAADGRDHHELAPGLRHERGGQFGQPFLARHTHGLRPHAERREHADEPIECVTPRRLFLHAANESLGVGNVERLQAGGEQGLAACVFHSPNVK